MILKIEVYPHSGREEIIMVSDSEYKIYLKKPAEDNKANTELLRVLKKHFNKKAKIIKGITSHNKLVEISD